MFPQNVLADIQRAKSFFSELDAEDTANLESGCSSCMVKNYECLSVILNSLEMKVELDEYDDVAIKEYGKMLVIIGDFTVQVAPTVFAGVNQIVPIDQTAYFDAIIVPGSGTIVSVLWTQINGTPATLTNADTPNLSVTNFPIGNITLQVTVTDSNNLTAVDTVALTGEAVTPNIKVYYLFRDTNDLPNEAEILASSFVNVVPDSDYVVPVDVLNSNPKFVFIFEPSTETYKARWEDVIDPDNGGLIGVGKTWNNTNPVGVFRGYVTEFKTQFPNPIKMIKGTPQP